MSLHPAILALAAAALLALSGAADARLRRLARMGASIAAAFWIGAPERYELGAGRALDVPWPLNIVPAALALYGLSGAAAALARGGGPALSCCAAGLVGVAALGWAGGAGGVALGAASGALASMALAVRRGSETLALGAGGFAAASALQAAAAAQASPFALALMFLPLALDAALTAARGAGALHLYEIGARAGLRRDHVAWAYWFVSAHCVALGAIASEAARRIGDGGGRFALVAQLAPVIVFLAMSLLLFKLSSDVRRYAAARGL